MTGSRFTVLDVDGVAVLVLGVGFRSPRQVAGDTITLALQRPGAGVVPGGVPVGPES